MPKNKDKTTEEMIREKGLTAPRVTKDLIKSKIVGKDIIEVVTPKGSIILIGLYSMSNGFTVTGSPIVINLKGATKKSNKNKEEIITYNTVSGSILRFAYKENSIGLVTVGRPSASVSPENEDEEIGVKIAIENCVADINTGYTVKPIDNIKIEEARELALENAFSEIWSLEGYLLATQLTEKQN